MGFESQITATQLTFFYASEKYKEMSVWKGCRKLLTSWCDVFSAEEHSHPNEVLAFPLDISLSYKCRLQ